MNATLKIREIDPMEYPFLNEMLYQAIYFPEGVEPLPKEIIREPELACYINNFGKPDDICLIAEMDGVLVGAIWTRLFSEEEKAYGFVDSETPELSMAVDVQFRKKGIGKRLLQSILQILANQGYAKVSLSVDKQNYAYDLYKRFGFVDYESTEKSATMLKIFTELG